jgi:hypothetical protein
MKQITTKKELNQIVDKYKAVFEINGVIYDYCLDSSDIVIKAINSESYIVKRHSKRKVAIERDLRIPKLEDVLQEMMDYYYEVPEEAGVEFESKIKELLNKYNIKKHLTKEEYDFVEEYDIKPLVKSILEDKISKIKSDKLIKLYKEKLEKM